jgi:hypothetical protein
MKKMKNIKRIFAKLVFFLCIGIIGCNNFDDINTNPDSITTSNAAMQATDIILANLRFGGRDAKTFLTHNALSKYIGYVEEGMMAYQYNQLSNASFGAMTVLPNIERMIEYAENQGTAMEFSYRGIAKFSRAYMFYRLTMEVGDIPYSQTGQGLQGNYTPKFDAQRDVLIGILDELKEADAYFARGVRFNGDPTPYNGDPDRWRRASNAFALRVLMSLSKQEADPALRVRERFVEIVNRGYLMEESTGFLGLQYTSVNRHPVSSTNDMFTSRTLVSSLLINELTRLNDRRLFYFAEPTPLKLHEGLSASDFEAFVGPDVERNYTTLTTEFLTGKYSILNLRYLTDPASEPRMMVTFAEQQLILAEARIRNWITNGNAEDFYKTGVRSALAAQMNTNATFAHGMPITQAYIDNYFTGEAAFKTTADEQLKQIWMQRYILNFMQDAQMSYFEYRRNKFPEFPIDPTTNLNLQALNAIPMRWLYPTSETNFNRENLIEALKNQFNSENDDVNGLMWILR